MRRHAGRLLELPRKMVHRQSRNISQRRESMLSLRCASTYSRTRRVAPGGRPPRVCGAGPICRILASRSKRGRVCRAVLIVSCQAPEVLSGGVTSAGQISSLPATTSSRRDIGRVLAPKERAVLFEQAPQADTGSQPSIIEQERGACGSVCADDALVAVGGQQHAGSAIFRRGNRDDPLSAELLSEKSLFYGARRCHRKGAGQRMRSFRPAPDRSRRRPEPPSICPSTSKTARPNN